MARVVISMSAPNWSPSLPETESTSPVGVRRVRTWPSWRALRVTESLVVP